MSPPLASRPPSARPPHAAPASRPPSSAPPPPHAPGGYRLCSRLGSGGQADIFLAFAPGALGAGRPVVLKQLRRSALDQPELVAAFLDEARLSARLDHPNVVRTYAAGAGEAYFIAMEYLEGQPLDQIVARARSGGLGPAAFARIAADALAGLHHAHELRDFDGAPLDVVHRDVSPHNLFVTYEGEVKVLDFGVAKASLNRAHTQVGAIKGKAGYMAPEQALGRADRRADVFAMGVVLWQALAGRRPFEGDLFRVLKQVLDEPVPRLSSVVPDVDPRLDAIVARAVERDPGARYPTALEMREALEGYLAGAGEPVRPEDLGRWLREAFAGERERARARLREAMGGATYEPTEQLPALSFDDPPPAAPPRRRPAPPPRLRYAASQFLLGLASFVVVGAAAALFIATSHSNPAPPPPPPAAASAPPRAAPAPPPPPRPGE
ncbi:MAG TPA: serine/threonine-protein kinase [Polyangiaceae bacterium]|nr:serine/threonine-protein kinase [Polyangiaceae bacterium]